MKLSDLKDKGLMIKNPNYIPKYTPGTKIGRAIITGYYGDKITKSGGKTKSRHYYTFDCSCGSKDNCTQVDVLDRAIRENSEFSCGCVSAERCRTELIHNQYRDRYIGTRYDRNSDIHKEYKALYSRCYGKSDPRYSTYGERGIRVADEWLGGEGYNKFCDWMYDVAGYDSSKEFGHKFNLNRCDNDGPYAPWNCYIASNLEQSNNKSTSFEFDWYGQRYTMHELCHKFGKDPIKFRRKYVIYKHPLHECLFGPTFGNQFDRERYLKNSINGLAVTPRAFVIYPFRFVDYSTINPNDPRRSYEHFNHQQALSVMDYIERRKLKEQGSPVKPFRFTNSSSTDFLLKGKFQC